MSARKVPVTIVTGFLGAGKTTLVRHTIENAEGRRLALIVNEFGDVGVDGAILRSCGVENCPDENIIELTNGCLCCTVADDFVPTLEALLALNPPPEHIIVETSGLALPKPLIKAFEWPDIRDPRHGRWRRDGRRRSGGQGGAVCRRSDQSRGAARGGSVGGSRESA